LPSALGFLCQIPPNNYQYYYHVHAAHHTVQTHDAVQDLGRNLVSDHEPVLLWRADLKGYGRLVGRESEREREREREREEAKGDWLVGAWVVASGVGVRGVCIVCVCVCVCVCLWVYATLSMQLSL